MKSSGRNRLATARLHAAITSLPTLPVLGFAALAALAGSSGLLAQTTINSGANVFTTETTLNLGALTRSAGGSALFTGGGVISATGTLSNGILGPWAIVQRSGTSANNSANGYTFATLSGGNITPYTGATSMTLTTAWGGIPSGGTGTINYDISSSGTLSVTGLNRDVNTLRYTGAGATQPSNINSVGNVLTANGIMNAGTGEFFIGGTGGANNYGINVTIGAGRDLVLAPMSAGITLRNGILNNSGGASALTVAGNLTTSLLGVSSFTGATSVNGGTLLVGGAGSINTSSGITVNGSNAKYLHTSSVASTRAITLAQGTVDGVGTLGTVNIADSATNILANGNGATGTLNVGTLTFSGDATVNARILAGATPINVTGALTTTAAGGTVTLNLAAPGGWSTGLNNLIGFGSFSGSLSDFTLGALSGTNARQSAGALSLNGNNIAIQINGDSPKWTGAQSGAWTTATIGGSSNWRLITAGTDTDFLAADNVLFDDTASGSTAVEITTANVAPASVTFDHSAKNYTLSSAGGFGIASGSLIKSGTGTLTVTNANTYTGTTTINGGTLQLGDGVTDGSISTSGAIVNNGALVYNNIGAQAYGNVISGSGTLGKQGAGVLTLTGANTYAGGSTLSAGETILSGNGTLGSGAINVASGAKLSINKNLTLTNTLTGSGQIVNTGSTVITGDATGFAGSYVHDSAGVSTSLNSATASSKDASYHIASVQGSSQGMIAAGVGDYTLEIGALSGVANSLFRGGNVATGTTTLKIGNLGTNTAFEGSINNGVTKTLALTKVGVGSLTLGGVNTYTGATSVEQGALLVNGSLASASVNVSAVTGTATLGGSGTIAGATTVGANGILSAGNSAGVLSFSGNLSLGTGSTSLFEINGADRATDYDGVNVGGALTYGGTFTLDFGAPIEAGTYDLFAFGTAPAGAFDNVDLVGAFAELLFGPATLDGDGWTAASAGWTYDFDYASGDLVIAANAIPEPSAFAALAGIAGLGAAALRRRRRA